MTNIVFIGGTGRCGTNIMKDILTLHPKVASHPFEYKFIIDPDGIMDFYSTAINCWSPYIINKKIHRLENFLKNLTKNKVDDIYKEWELEKHLPNYEKNCEELISRLIDFKYNGFFFGLKEKSEIYFMSYRSQLELQFILGKFIRNLIDGYLISVNKEYYVEDNTHNILLSKELLELIPEAKIICMVRSPKDVISSLSKTRWAPNDKIKAAFWYKSIMERWNQIKNALPKESYLIVDLYELIDDTENVLRNICNYIEINYDDKMLTLDLSKSNKDRWKKDFSPRELLEIEKIISSIKIQ